VIFTLGFCHFIRANQHKFVPAFQTIIRNIYQDSGYKTPRLICIFYIHKFWLGDRDLIQKEQIVNINFSNRMLGKKGVIMSCHAN
jgi:hypothetical protein